MLAAAFFLLTWSDEVCYCEGAEGIRPGVFVAGQKAVVVLRPRIPSARIFGNGHDNSFLLLRRYSMDEYGSDWPMARKKALKRDGYRCYYCGCKERLQVHHIRPVLSGGTNDQWNLVTLCSDCHRSDHRDIRMHGLCVLPGPAYEEYRYQLTNQNDVLRYADYLETMGLDGSTLRALEGQ
jgi:hypothetical protein